MPSLDNINQLIEDIESQSFNYVIGIIKKDPKDPAHESIEIFTNIGDSPLEKLLKVLKQHQKSIKAKEEKPLPTEMNIG